MSQWDFLDLSQQTVAPDLSGLTAGVDPYFDLDFSFGQSFYDIGYLYEPRENFGFGNLAQEIDKVALPAWTDDDNLALLDTYESTLGMSPEQQLLNLKLGYGETLLRGAELDNAAKEIRNKDMQNQRNNDWLDYMALFLPLGIQVWNAMENRRFQEKLWARQDEQLEKTLAAKLQAARTAAGTPGAAITVKGARNVFGR